MASRGLNKVILIGNLGNDPEIRLMPNGESVANFSIATSESWKDKHTGEQKEQTEWHRIVAYRRLAEIIGQYLHKGSKVYIEGRIRTRKWTDQNNQDRYSTEIIANELQMLDRRDNSQDQAILPSGDEQNTPAQKSLPTSEVSPEKQRDAQPGPSFDFGGEEIPY